jgi:hypothetical protein
VLAPLILRELHDRLLQGEQHGRLAEMAIGDGRLRRVSMRLDTPAPHSSVANTSGFLANRRGAMPNDCATSLPNRRLHLEAGVLIIDAKVRGRRRSAPTVRHCVNEGLRGRKLSAEGFWVATREPSLRPAG